MDNLSVEKACFLVVKAREFDVKVPPVEPDPGSNPADEKELEVLEDYDDDPTLEEFTGALEALNEDERIELLALIWLGRGDYSPERWGEAVAAARDALNERFVRYVAGIPLVGDYIEEGLAQLGHSCDDVAIEHL